MTYTKIEHIKTRIMFKSSQKNNQAYIVIFGRLYFFFFGDGGEYKNNGPVAHQRDFLIVRLKGVLICKEIRFNLICSITSLSLTHSTEI